MKKIFSVFFCFMTIFVASYADEVQFRYNGGRNYSLVERTDLRRYENNRYTGLLNREVRSFISNDGELYEGSFYVSQDTVRASAIVGDMIHDSIPSRFRISSEGILTMIEDHGYPSFRSFPAFTANKIRLGDSWQAQAVRAVDPLNKGIVTKIPMYVQYTYTGDETVRGEEVYVVSARWATRYGANLYMDFGGDRDLKQAMGKHEATMYISKVTGNAIVVRDSVDETFVYTDGRNISFRGTISLFTEYPPAVDRSRIIRALQRVAAISDEEAELLTKKVTPEPLPLAGESVVAEVRRPGNNENETRHSGSFEKRGYNGKSRDPAEIASGLNRGVSAVDGRNSGTVGKGQKTAERPIKVENTPAGIRLTVQNLQFKPDSAELLPGEKSRLDQIASVLRETPQSQFLVEGHTAATGNERGEMTLSAQRAHSIAKELAARGIPSEKFICKGSGSHKPIADNSTQEGKAANRRVEITILE